MDIPDSPEPITTPEQLLEWLEALNSKLEISGFVSQMRLTLQANSQVRKYVKDILAHDPEIDGPDDSPIPGEYLRCVRLWCQHQIRKREKPAETGPDTTPAKGMAKIGWLKRIAAWIFKKTWHLIVAIIVAIIGSFIAAILIRYFW